MSLVKRILPAAALALLGSATSAAADGGNTSFDPGPTQPYRKYFLANFFAEDAEWKPGDTRDGTYANQYGTPQLVAGRTTTTTINGQPATIEESRLILDRLSLVTSGPSPAAGSIYFNSPANLDKATIENRTFFANVEDFSGISFEYDWYRSSGGVAAPALKLGIDTVELNPTDTADTKHVLADRGEDRFDKILVYEPYLQGRPTADGTWTTETIGANVGLFWLVNLTPNSAYPATSQTDLRTLAQWRATLPAGTIKSLQLGVGSYNPSQKSYVEHLAYTNGNDSLTATASTTWYFFPDPPPAGSISPSDTIIAQGDALTLTGSAVDAVGSALAAGSLLWYSSRDGLFGTGESASAAGLSPGIHEISLVAMDGNGDAVAAARTTIAVSGQLASCQGDLAASRAQAAQSSAQLAQALAQLATASTDLATARNQLAAANHALATAQGQLATCQSDLATARAQAAQAGAQLAQAAAQLAQALTQLARSATDLATARRQLTLATSALATAQAQLSAYTGDIREMLRLLGLSPARRKREPNKGLTSDGRAVIAILLRM